jgi:hypothetical protein
MRGHWLKAIGHARGPLAETWLEERPELLRRTGFPRRPRIQPGDRLVYYASVWRRVFAVVEAVGEPEPREHPRWPWAIAVEPLLVVPVLDAAPPVEAIGVAHPHPPGALRACRTGARVRRALNATGRCAAPAAGAR